MPLLRFCMVQKFSFSFLSCIKNICSVPSLCVEMDNSNSKDDTSLSDPNLCPPSTSAGISKCGQEHKDNMTSTKDKDDCRYFSKELRDSLSTVKSFLKRHEDAAISAIMNNFLKDAVIEIVHSNKYLVGPLKEKLKMKYYVLLIEEEGDPETEELGLNAMREKGAFIESEAKTVRDTIMKIVLEKCKVIKEINESFKSDLLPDTTIEPGNFLSNDKIGLMHVMHELKLEKEEFKENLEKCKEKVNAIEQVQSMKSKEITDKIECMDKDMGNLDLECKFLEQKVEVSANTDDKDGSMEKALDKLIEVKQGEYEQKQNEWNELKEKMDKYRKLMEDEKYVNLRKEYNELMSELEEKRKLLQSMH